MIYDVIATVPDPVRPEVLAFRWTCPTCKTWGRVTLARAARAKAAVHKAVIDHKKSSPTCRTNFQLLQLRQERLEEARA